MKQRTILFCFFAIAVLSAALVVVFWTPIKLSFIEWSLKEYAHKTLGHDLTIDRISAKEKNLVQLEGITLKAPESSEKVLVCNQADLRILFDWQKRKLDCRIQLDRPKLLLPSLKQKVPQQISRGFRGHRFLFQPHYKIQTANGLLQLGESKEGSLLFTIELGKALAGSAMLGFDGGREWLGLQFQQGKRLGNYKWSTEGIDARNLTDFLSLFDERCRLVQIQKGKVFGTLSHLNEKGNWTVDKAVVRAAVPEISFVGSNKKVTNFNLRLGIEKGEFLPQSRMTFFYDTLMSSIVFEGKKSEDPLKVRIVGNLNAFMERSGFHENIALKDPGQLIEIEAYAKGQDNGYWVDGEAVLNRGGGERDLWLLSAFFNLSTGALERGDFASPDISFDHYLSGFKKDDDFVEVKGRGAFSGCWDSHSVNFRWERGGFQLHHPSWFFSIDHLRAGSRAAYLKKEKDWIGCFFLEEGRFYEKNHEIELKKIDSELHLTTDQLLEGRVEAVIDLIPFRGYLTASLPASGRALEIELKEPVIEGDLATGLRMLRYFYPSIPFFPYVPETELILSPEDSRLVWSWEEKKMHSQANLKGTVVQCGDVQLIPGLKMDDLIFRFDINCHENHVRLSDLKANMKIGKGNKIKTFHLFGDEIFFENKSKPYLHFDFWAGDRTRDYLRLKGESQGIGKRQAKVVFDKKNTHYGTIYPKKFDLTIDDKLHVQRGKLHFFLPLKDLVVDVQQLADLGFLHPENVERLHSSSGGIDVSLDLCPPMDELAFHLEGNNLSVADSPIDRFEARGSLNQKKWRIDHCRVNSVSLSADCRPVNRGVAIDFFGCNFGNTSMVGMNGKYDAAKKRLEANLNLVEFDLSRLSDFHSLPSWTSSLNLEGRVRANQGNLSIKFFQPNDIAAIDLAFNASLKNFKFAGIPFHDKENLFVKVQSDRGIIIKNGIKDPSIGHFNDVGYDFEKIDYRFPTGDFQIDHFHFFLPVDTFPTVDRLVTVHPQLNAWKTLYLLFREGSAASGMDMAFSLSHCPDRETAIFSLEKKFQHGPFQLEHLNVINRRGQLEIESEIEWSKKDLAQSIEFPLSMKKKFTRKELIDYFPLGASLEMVQEGRSFRMKKIASNKGASPITLSLSEEAPSYVTPYESVDLHLCLRPKHRIIKAEKYFMDIFGEWERPAYTIRKASSKKSSDR